LDVDEGEAVSPAASKPLQDPVASPLRYGLMRTFAENYSTRVTGLWFEVFGDAPLKSNSSTPWRRCRTARKETKVHRLSQVRM